MADKAISGFGRTSEAPTNDTLPLLELRPKSYTTWPQMLSQSAPDMSVTCSETNLWTAGG
jgi:hypothetical protein